MAVKDFSKPQEQIRFADVVCKMATNFSKLKECKLVGANTNEFPPKPGVYVFYENDEAQYVGRTGNIKKRIPQHRNLGSTDNDAPFAYHIAKFSARAAGIDTNDTRKNLCNQADFKLHFKEAKERINKMQVRFIEIKDAREQSLFEYYASIELNTRWNDHSNS